MAAEIPAKPYETNLANWLSIDASKLTPAYWKAANWSEFDWTVKLLNGIPIAIPAEQLHSTNSVLPFPIKAGAAEQRGEPHVVKVVDGWLVGWNSGEWGGSVSWFSPDGSEKYQVCRDQVIGFFPGNNEVLAPAGLAHLDISYGKLLRLNQSNGHWISRSVVDLKAAPEAAGIDKDGSLIVATTDRLVRIKSGEELTVILPKAFWRILYPNSLVVGETGNVYIGMRHGVARVEKTGRGYRVLWLVPEKSFLATKDLSRQ